MEIRKRKTRMYEPWGYRDENNYQGASIILDNDLDSFFAEVSYNKDDNKIHFANKDGEEKATIDVNEFVKSDSIVEKAWYENGKIYIKFTNGDTITIDVEELIDQNEFADGLKVNEGVVSVLIDGESEAFLSVSSNGVKISGVQDAIDAERDRAISAETALDEKIDQEIADREADVNEEEARAISAETALDQKIDAETARAEAAEQALDEKIEAETARATSAETELQAAIEAEGQRAQDAEAALDEKIDAETTRATAEEQRIDAKLDQEIADRKEDVDTEEVRAKAAEAALDVRIDTLNDALVSETRRAESAEQELSTRLTTEIQDRKDDVDEEENRAKAAEAALDAKIDKEIADRINAVENEEEAREAADNRLQEAITSEVSRATNAETLLNQKLDQEIADREADVLAEENRAISAETELQNTINAEISRATSAESTLQANIDAEATARENRDVELTGLIEAETVRATSKETEIETNLTAEIANREADVDAEEGRAISAETALDNKIDAEIADRKAEAIASAEYVKNDVKIYFKNDNGDTLSEIDCNDFIADGMIENVELVESGDTSVLVITWNTDGGSKVTRLDVGDIFEADNYYTKVQIDAIEEGLQDEIDAEEIRANAAESALTEALAAETRRAQGAEGNLQDAIDAEEARATSAETGLNNAIAAEASTARAAEQANANAIAAEQTRAENAESTLTDAIAAEETRAKAAEQANTNAITAEETRATSAETNLQSAIDAEATRAQAEEALKANAADVYTKGEIDGKETALQAGINANASGITAEEERAEDAEQVLQDNITAEETRAKAAEAKKVDRQVNGTNGKALIFNETDGGGAKFENTDGINSFVGVNDAGANGIDAQIYAINKDTKEGSRLDVSNTGVYYTVGSDAPASRMVADNEIATRGNVNEAVSGKADAETVYTKEDVDALLLAKENEIAQIKKDYNNLKEIVGELGGNVEWGVPADGTFNNMMKKSGIVKLGEDTTTSTYAGGITSKNETTLNLNGKNLTFSGNTTNNPGIMTRGKQKLTIMGKGTIDAAGRIAVEANGADTVINLSGTTTFGPSEPTYVTDRSGGELIYCYLGTINIYAGVFKNNGDDKKFLLNCYDANRAAGTAKIVVYGGKFYDFNPADNTAEGEHTNFLAPGYHVETSTDGESTVYTVKKDA